MTKSRIEIINTWVQTIAIVLAGSWALYTFFYSEVYKPSKIQGTLSSKIKMTDGGIKQGLQMIVANIELTNNSDRTLYTLDGYFVVYGYRQTLVQNPYFASDLNLTLEQTDESFHSKYSQVEGEIIAGGNIFEFYDFMVDGKSSKDLIFEFPDGVFDFIDLRVNIPIINQKYDLFVETVLDSASHSINVYPFFHTNDTTRVFIDWSNEEHQKLMESLDYSEVSFDAIISAYGDKYLP